LKYSQVNLQNLLISYIIEEEIGIVLAQELHHIDNKIALFPSNFHVLYSTNRPKSAIIVISINVKVMPLLSQTNDYIV
jgi:hypothetical protein